MADCARGATGSGSAPYRWGLRLVGCPSGGRKAYEKFWDAIDRVSVSRVTGKPPDKAEATVTYVYKDGRVVRERTAFGLVNDDGTLKINSSKVLSSSTE